MKRRRRRRRINLGLTKGQHLRETNVHATEANAHLEAVESATSCAEKIRNLSLAAEHIGAMEAHDEAAANDPEIDFGDALRDARSRYKDVSKRVMKSCGCGCK
jgi:hypothetical protein